MHSMTIPPDVAENYWSDGVAVARGLAGPDQIDVLSAFCSDAMAEPGPNAQSYGDGSGFFADLFMWPRHPTLEEFLTSGPLGHLAATVGGQPGARLFYDYLLVKEPGAANPTPWHQDLPYWPIDYADADKVVSTWVAIDHTTLENGGVEYIAGSHRWNKLFVPTSFSSESRFGEIDLEPIPDFEAERGEHRIVSFDLEPGDVVLHHPATVHGAPANLSSERRRRGLAVRWLTGDVHYEPREGSSAVINTYVDGLAQTIGSGDVLGGQGFPPSS